MAVDSSLVLPGRIAQERSGDHRFFTGMALASALTVFIGFARTYYLRSVFDGPPPLAFLSVPLGTLLA